MMSYIVEDPFYKTQKEYLIATNLNQLQGYGKKTVKQLNLFVVNAAQKWSGIPYPIEFQNSKKHCRIYSILFTIQ